MCVAIAQQYIVWSLASEKCFPFHLFCSKANRSIINFTTTQEKNECTLNRNYNLLTRDIKADFVYARLENYPTIYSKENKTHENQLENLKMD